MTSKEYRRAWYKKNPGKREEYAARWKAKHPVKWRRMLQVRRFSQAVHHWSKVEFCILLKEITPCTDCQRKDKYYLMHFDHTRGEKLQNVGTMGAWPSFSRELAKCDIVCVRCHSIRTWNRAQKA